MSKGQLLLLKQIIGAGDGSASLPLPTLRANLEAFLSRFPPVEGVSARPVNADGVPCEWLSGPWLEDPARAATLLYFHGGGFVVGSAASHRQLAARLARAAGARCLSVDYRLAPEHPYPAALEDAHAAYRWLLDQGSGQGDQIAWAGDSAGAGLALLAASQLPSRDLPRPCALVAMSPWVDYAGTTDSLDRHAALDPVVQRAGLEKMARIYLDGADPWDPAVTPLRADLSALPPLLIQAGGSESLLDDSQRLAERALAAGVPARLEVWPEMIHVWQLFAGRLDEGRQAIEQAGDFLQRAFRA
ncbi:MAG: alpha/beta hydrolase [Acidobacteriota bacterium]